MSIRKWKFGNFLSTVKKTFSRIIDFNIDEQKDFNELNELNNSNKNNLNDTPSLNNNDDLSSRFKYNSVDRKITRNEYINNNLVNDYNNNYNYILKNYNNNNNNNNNEKVNSMLKITQYINDNKFQNKNDLYINNNNNLYNTNYYNSLNYSDFKPLKNLNQSQNYNYDNNRVNNLNNSDFKIITKDKNMKYSNPFYSPNNNIYLGKKNPKTYHKINEEEEFFPSYKLQKQNAITDLMINNKSLEEIKKEIELKRKRNENIINEMSQNKIIKNIKTDYEDRKKNSRTIL